MQQRPLRILYLSHISVGGGAEQSLLRLMAALRPEEVERHLATPDGGPLADSIAALGIPLHPLPTLRQHRPRSLGEFVTFVREFCRHRRAIRRLCRAVQPDLIHANSLLSAWAAVGACRVPIIWHLRDLRGPARVLRYVRPRVAAVIAISQVVANALWAVAPRGAPICVIHNPLDERDRLVRRSCAEMRAEWGVPPQAPVIGALAALVPWKRHDLLLRALALVREKLPEARLVIIGSDPHGEAGDYLASLHTLRDALRLTEHVIFTGHVEHPADALAAVDVLAHAAADEPFGRAIIEALAVGLPVVAVGRAGPAEIITHGREGLLVEPDDPAAMAEALVQVLTEPALATAFSAAAKVRAADFEARPLALAVLDLYRRLMADRAGGAT